jgi:hypothetical protein
MTLVELLVAMAVTTMVLTAVTGVLYNVTSTYEGWSTRLDDASTGSTLAAALQRDSERYVVCHTVGNRVSQLTFCVPGTTTEVVTYTVRPDGGTFSILRQDLPGGKTILMARGVRTQAALWNECIPGDGTVSGHIHVYDYRRDTRSPDPRSTESFSVYYHAPLFAAGVCP